jgi:hypothetical protein
VSKWRPVVFSADCDEDGNCPRCRIDFADCDCPGPTQDGYEYKAIKGRLMARESSVIGRISNIRANNNVLWMRLLEIALKHAPADAKAALRQINDNDREISGLLQELTK